MMLHTISWAIDLPSHLFKRYLHRRGKREKEERGRRAGGNDSMHDVRARLNISSQ